MSNKAYAQYSISDIRDGKDGVGILELEEQYYKSTSNSSQTGGNWSSTQPTWENGYYIWTRLKITWDNDVSDPEHITYTDPVLATTYQSLHTDVINRINNIATKDANGNWSLTNGVIENTYVYTSEGGDPIALGEIGANITTTKDQILSTVSSTYATTANLNSEINKRKATYVTCSTGAGTKAKIGSCSNFELYNGATITCVFSNANTQAAPTLNVNGTGAKTIVSYDGKALTESEYKWKAGSAYTLVYDGTNWRMQDSGTVARLTTAESSITQNANNIALKVSESDVTGNYLIGKINLDSTTATISASRVNITGDVIVSKLSDDNKNTISASAISKAEEAIGKAEDAQSDASDAVSTANSANSTAQSANTNASNALSKANSSIKTDTLHYLATSASSGVTKSTSGWTTTVQSVDSTNRYLWTYHTYTKADNTTSDTNPVITGVYGDTGVGITSVTPLYYGTNSTTVPEKPTTSTTIVSSSTEYNKWNKTCPTWTTTYKYYFTCSEILYDNNTKSWSDVVRENALETANSTANTANTNASNALETANTAAGNASNALGKANTAIVEQKTLYYLTNGNAPAKPTSAVTSVSTSTGVWTTVIPTPKNGYTYYTCTQTKNGAGTYAWIGDSNNKGIKMSTDSMIANWCSASDSTYINGGSIYANSITTNQLATDAIKSNNYVAPTGTIGVSGTAPYSVSGSFFNLTDGSIITPNFVVNGGNAYLTGTIETESGHIGGFVITDNSIYYNQRDISSTDLSEVYMGIDGISCGFGKFAVDSSGELFASNATIKGNITATSGSFGADNGYYKINDNGLIGYEVETVYYFKMIELLIDGGYDEGSVKITSLSVETSTQSYSYSDILAINHVVGVDLKIEDDKTFVILKTDSSIPVSQIFDGTITTISCAYTFKQSGEEFGGNNEVHDYTGLLTPSSEDVNYITGTEVGYDFLKTENLIAHGGTIGDWTITESSISKTGAKNINLMFRNSSGVLVIEPVNASYSSLLSVGDLSITSQYTDSNSIVHEIYTRYGTFIDIQETAGSGMSSQVGHVYISPTDIIIENGSTFSIMKQDGTIQVSNNIETPEIWIGDRYWIDGTEIGSVVGKDLILTANDGTYGCRLTVNGNLRPSDTTGVQYLGTGDNRWKQLYCTTAPNVSSDVKTKDHIEEIDFSEKFIKNLKPVSFMLKNGDHRRKHMGFIAQDISQLCKDIGENLSVVSASYKDGYGSGKKYLGEDVDDNLLSWGMSYEELIAPMVCEIQRLMYRIDKLEEELKKYKQIYEFVQSNSRH